MAVSGEDADAAGGEIFLVDVGKAVGGSGEAEGVAGAMPGLAFDAEAEGGGVIDVGEDPAFVLAVAPAGAGEEADIFDDFLFAVEAETVFVAVGAGLGDVDAGHRKGLGITAHVGVVEVGEEAKDAGMVTEGVAAFQFSDHAPGFQKMFVEGGAIGVAGHLEQAVAEGPMGLIEFGGKAGDVAEGIGGIVPGFVGHEGPVEELGAGIVGVGVVIENVLGGKFAQGEGEAGDVLLAGEGELIVVDVFLVAAEADGLAEEEAGEIDVGGIGAEAEGFAVGKAIDAEGVVDAETLPQEAVEVGFSAGPEAEAGH